jgi:hypothetical protein
MSNEQLCEVVSGGFGSPVDGRIPVQRCVRPALWLVSVNPPNTQGLPEKVRVCGHCIQFNYHGFRREALSALDVSVKP